MQGLCGREAGREGETERRRGKEGKRGTGGEGEREEASQDIFENRLDILCNSIYEKDEKKKKKNRSRGNGTCPGLRQTLGKCTALLSLILQV